MTAVHIICHRHFYDLFFSIYLPRLTGYSSNYRFYPITILEVLAHFKGKNTVSHIKDLMNPGSFHELLQHVAMAGRMSDNVYYHVSASHQGYDGFSCNPNDLLEIKSSGNGGLMTLYEKKTLRGSNVETVLQAMEKYSIPKLVCKKGNQGARPFAVDELEFGTFSKESYSILKESSELNSITVLKPDLIIRDYSDMYEKMVFPSNPKQAGFLDNTTITDLSFEKLKYFYYLLEQNEEICAQVNTWIEDNPFFPLIMK